MRRLLAGAAAAVLTAVTLVGCDSDTSDVDSAPTPTVVPVAATVVAVLTGDDSGGSTSIVASRLDLPGAAASFADQFGQPLRNRVVATADQVRHDPGEVYAQVVGLDCAVTDGVTVERLRGQVVIAPVDTVAPPQDCDPKVTTIAVVRVAGDA